MASDDDCEKAMIIGPDYIYAYEDKGLFDRPKTTHF